MLLQGNIFEKAPTLCKLLKKMTGVGIPPSLPNKP